MDQEFGSAILPPEVVLSFPQFMKRDYYDIVSECHNIIKDAVHTDQDLAIFVGKMCSRAQEWNIIPQGETWKGLFGPLCDLMMTYRRWGNTKKDPVNRVITTTTEKLEAKTELEAEFKELLAVIRNNIEHNGYFSKEEKEKIGCYISVYDKLWFDKELYDAKLLDNMHPQLQPFLFWQFRMYKDIPALKKMYKCFPEGECYPALGALRIDLEFVGLLRSALQDQVDRGGLEARFAIGNGPNAPIIEVRTLTKELVRMRLDENDVMEIRISKDLVACKWYDRCGNSAKIKSSRESKNTSKMAFGATLIIGERLAEVLPVALLLEQIPGSRLIIFITRELLDEVKENVQEAMKEFAMTLVGHLGVVKFVNWAVLSAHVKRYLIKEAIVCIQGREYKLQAILSKQIPHAMEILNSNGFLNAFLKTKMKHQLFQNPAIPYITSITQNEMLIVRCWYDLLKYLKGYYKNLIPYILCANWHKCEGRNLSCVIMHINRDKEMGDDEVLDSLIRGTWYFKNLVIFEGRSVETSLALFRIAKKLLEKYENQLVFVHKITDLMRLITEEGGAITDTVVITALKRLLGKTSMEQNVVQFALTNKSSSVKLDVFLYGDCEVGSDDESILRVVQIISNELCSIRVWITLTNCMIDNIKWGFRRTLVVKAQKVLSAEQLFWNKNLEKVIAPDVSDLQFTRGLLKAPNSIASESGKRIWTALELARKFRYAHNQPHNELITTLVQNRIEKYILEEIGLRNLNHPIAKAFFVQADRFFAYHAVKSITPEFLDECPQNEFTSVEKYSQGCITSLLQLGVLTSVHPVEFIDGRVAVFYWTRFTSKLLQQSEERVLKYFRNFTILLFALMVYVTLLDNVILVRIPHILRPIIDILGNKTYGADGLLDALFTTKYPIRHGVIENNFYGLSMLQLI